MKVFVSRYDTANSLQAIQNSEESSSLDRYASLLIESLKLAIHVNTESDIDQNMDKLFRSIDH